MLQIPNFSIKNIYNIILCVPQQTNERCGVSGSKYDPKAIEHV